MPCVVVDFAEMDYLMRGDGSISAIPANLQRMQVAHLHCCPTFIQGSNLSQEKAAMLSPSALPATMALLTAQSHAMANGSARGEKYEL